MVDELFIDKEKSIIRKLINDELSYYEDYVYRLRAQHNRLPEEWSASLLSEYEEKIGTIKELQRKIEAIFDV